MSNDIAFHEIEKEFRETFGFVRQDIAALLNSNLGLNYTIAALVCFACEMLTWHRGLRDDQAHEIFTSLLPDTEDFRTIGKTLWEALRNGLAHNFRPHTIRIEDEEWRFTISSQDGGPHIGAWKGTPHWIHLNICTCSSRVIAQIDTYEQELRNSQEARLNFRKRSEAYIKPIKGDASRITNALTSILGQTHV